MSVIIFTSICRFDDTDPESKKESTMKRDTVGKIAGELLLKQPDSLSPIDNMREQLTDYEKNLFECIERHKNTMLDDFFVVVITKKERLMPNVLRNYFFACVACPTPNYDQIVYKYFKKEERLDFIWVIPSQDTCHLMKENALQVPPEEKQLLDFVLNFADGSLFKLAKKLNGEVDDSPLLDKKG